MLHLTGHATLTPEAYAAWKRKEARACAEALGTQWWELPYRDGERAMCYYALFRGEVSPFSLPRLLPRPGTHLRLRDETRVRRHLCCFPRVAAAHLIAG